MKILVDSDVVLDVLAERQPFHAASAVVWSLSERRQIEGLVSALSISNVYYILRKAVGGARALESTRLTSRVFSIVAVDSDVVRLALDAAMPDFEDGLQAFAGVRAGATHMVTRDQRGFVAGPLQVLSPDQLAEMV